MFLSIVIGVVFAIIVIILYPSKQKISVKQSTNSRVEGDEVEKNNGVIEKHSLKMMSYEEALEASKKFIYDIARAVIQRFTPGSQQELKSIGQKLYDAGVEYVHVVDIFSLSMKKNKARGVKSTSKGRASGV